MINRNIITSSIAFILGFAGGAVGGFYFAKNKYLSMAEKEIESVRKVYEKHFKSKEETSIDKKSEPRKPTPVPLIDPEKEDYKNYAGMYGPGNSENPVEVPSKRSIATPKAPKKVNTTKKVVPYVITPDDFRDSEYEATTLIYYSDKILADSDGNVIHDINGLIGPEALSTFGRYLDDTVYVRDDSKRIDYEIMWDTRKYSSVKNIIDDKTLDTED